MNKKKLTLIIGATIIILMVTLTIIYEKNKEEDTPIQNEKEEIKKIDEIIDFDYYLEEDATTYYKELYDELKNIIGSEEIDYKEYSNKVSQLFVTDLFSLDNKISSNDIGGLQFIYPGFKEDFIKIAQTTLYSSVESNIYGDRNQELPIVTKVNIVSTNESTFNYNDTTYESYEVNLEIDYEKDLSYPKNYKVTLIKNDKYIQVVSSE